MTRNMPAAKRALPPPTHLILVAEDDESYREMLRWLLERSGHTVVTAADGAEAWDMLQHGDYDLLLTDNEMPKLKGVDLIARMRGAGIGIPVIMLSSSFDNSEAQAGPLPDIAENLGKCISRQQLSAAVQRAVGH